MKKETLLGLIGGALCTSTTFATETIQPIDVHALIGLSAQEDDAAAAATTGHAHHVHHGHHGADAGSEHGPHLRINAGVSLISETNIKNSNDGIKWDPGVEFNVAYGLALVGDLALELGVGMTYNSMKESFDQAGQTGNADGELWQIPVMAHLVYEFHFGENLVLGVNGGAGIQYNSLTLDSFGGVTDGRSQSSWTVRYEVGLELTWSLSDTSALGAYSKYAWAPGIELPDDGEFDTVRNMSVGVMYIHEF